MKRSRGTGSLVNRRRTAPSFRAVSERTSFIDIKVNGKFVRVVGVYMLHSGYQDADVDQVYDTLEGVVDEAGANHPHCIIAGDFNAEVGTLTEHYNSSILGPHGISHRSSRRESADPSLRSSVRDRN